VFLGISRALAAVGLDDHSQDRQEGIMRGGKTVVEVSVIVLMAAGAIGGSRGFGPGEASSYGSGLSYGSGSSYGSRSSYGSGSLSLPMNGSSVGTPRDTPSGLDLRLGVGTTGGINGTIGTPRDTDLGDGGTTGGVGGE
jgi:hypothetical protein